MSGINTLKPDPGSTHKTKRIGRGPGSGHGKTAGRGHKGMWSRSGSHQKRGFEVGPKELLDAGVIRRLAKDGLRVLGDGQIDRALHVSAHHFSEGAREKITKAGGTCEVITL